MSISNKIILKLENVTVDYNGIYAIKKINLDIIEGEVVSVLGPNGAGKTTLLRAISGLVQPVNESNIIYKGINITKMKPYKINRLGICHVPEGRQIFPSLTVLENLEVAAFRLSHSLRKKKIEYVFSLFQELSSRKNQLGGSLSGGEQQMLAIGRAIVSNANLILIDEPSMGLAPIIVQRIFKTLKELMKENNLTLLLVEQNAKLSLPLSDRIYVLSQGSIVLEGAVEDIKENKIIQDMYFAKK